MLISTYVGMMFHIEFSTNSSSNFLSRTASFHHNMKGAQKSLFITITDSLVFKNLSTTNAQCAPVQAIIVPEKQNGKTLD